MCDGSAVEEGARDSSADEEDATRVAGPRGATTREEELLNERRAALGGALVPACELLAVLAAPPVAAIVRRAVKPKDDKRDRDGRKFRPPPAITRTLSASLPPPPLNLRGRLENAIKFATPTKMGPDAVKTL